MPILVAPSDASLLGGLAVQAGQAAGFAEVAQQLRQRGATRDAMILESRLRQQERDAATPAPASPGGGTQGPVQTFRSDAAVQTEKMYGTPAEQQSRERAAALFDGIAARETDPDKVAAAKSAAEDARRGVHIEDWKVKAAGIKSQADADREAALHQQKELAEKKMDATAQAAALKAQKPTFSGPTDANAHDIAWTAPAETTAAMLKQVASPPTTDPLTGEPDKTYKDAVAVHRMLNSEFRGKSTGEIMVRLKELRAAGAPAETLKEAYTYVAETWKKAETVRQTVAKLATDAAGHVGKGKLDPAGASKHRAEFRAKALQAAGVSSQDYLDWITEYERSHGLSPAE